MSDNKHWPSPLLGFPGGPVVRNPPLNAGDRGLTPGLGRSPGGGNGNLLQDSCLGNPVDRGHWWAIVLRITAEQVFHCVYIYEYTHAHIYMMWCAY